MKLILPHHLLTNLAPFLAAKMFNKNDEHESMGEIPSAIDEVRIQSIAKLVVNLINVSKVHELVDLLPIFVELLLGQNYFVLFGVEFVTDLLLCAWNTPLAILLEFAFFFPFF